MPTWVTHLIIADNVMKQYVCIVRKIGVMGYLPKLDENLTNPISISREEFVSFVDNTVLLVVSKLRENNLINSK